VQIDGVLGMADDVLKEQIWALQWEDTKRRRDQEKENDCTWAQT
jgi:hypothetical protein